MTSDANTGSYRILDVSNIVSPTQISSATVFAPTYGMALTSTHAFLPQSLRGMAVYDIHSRTNASYISERATVSRVNDIALSGDLALVASSECGLVVFNIEDRANPVHVSTFPMNFQAVSPQAVVVHNGDAYVRDYYNGIRIVDVRNPLLPALVATYPNTDSITLAACAGSRAYISDRRGFDIVDITNPAVPTKIGGIHWKNDTGGFGPSLVSREDFVYAYGTVFSVKDPTNPVPVAESGLSGNLKISDNYLFGASGNVLGVTDISTPLSPRPLTSFQSAVDGSPIRDFAVVANTAYLAHLKYTVIVDLTDSAKPFAVRTNTFPYEYWAASYIAAEGDKLYEYRKSALLPTGSLSLEDIFNRSNPRAVTNLALPPICGMAMSGGLLYVVVQPENGQGVLKIFEGQLPTRPSLPALTATYANGNVIVRWPTGFPVNLYSAPWGTPFSLVTSNPQQDGTFIILQIRGPSDKVCFTS